MHGLAWRQSRLGPPRAVSKVPCRLCKGLLSSHRYFLAVGLSHSFEKPHHLCKLWQCIFFSLETSTLSLPQNAFLTPPPCIARNNEHPSDQERGWTLPSDSHRGRCWAGVGVPGVSYTPINQLQLYFAACGRGTERKPPVQRCPAMHPHPRSLLTEDTVRFHKQ